MAASLTGVAAGIVVWSIDRELISGNGQLAVRGIVGAVNALLIGEIILLALFAPFVTQELDRYREIEYQQASDEANAEHDSGMSRIDQRSEAFLPSESERLVEVRTEVADASTRVAQLESQLTDLRRVRTAEVTGRVVFDDQGQQLTTGRQGDRGVATSSIDSEIESLEASLGRAVDEFERASASLAEQEERFDVLVGRADQSRADLQTDRDLVLAERELALAAALSDRDRPAGLLLRIEVFHRAVWSDLVLAISVVGVHLAILAAELSVVLWAINDRRRPIRLYRGLLDEVDHVASGQLRTLAKELVAIPPADVVKDESAVEAGPAPPAMPQPEEVVANEEALAPSEDDVHGGEQPSGGVRGVLADGTLGNREAFDKASKLDTRADLVRFKGARYTPSTSLASKAPEDSDDQVQLDLRDAGIDSEWRSEAPVVEEL